MGDKLMEKTSQNFMLHVDGKLLQMSTNFYPQQSGLFQDDFTSNTEAQALLSGFYEDEYCVTHMVWLSLQTLNIEIGNTPTEGIRFLSLVHLWRLIEVNLFHLICHPAVSIPKILNIKSANRGIEFNKLLGW